MRQAAVATPGPPDWRDEQKWAVKLTKRSLNRALDMQGFRNSLMAHFDTHQLAHLSDEFRAVREAGPASAIARQRG